MLDRRSFLSKTLAATATAVISQLHATTSAKLSHKERVDRALAGRDVDRPPFTFYKHYKKQTPRLEAMEHLKFHRTYHTDLVKVMNDFDYPKSTTGRWFELQPIDSPYPKQLRTLELVRDGLDGDVHFIDTVFSPYMIAMLLLADEMGSAGRGKLGGISDAVIERLSTFQADNANEWDTALEAITVSTINHIRLSKQVGSSGALVSIFNAKSKCGSVSDYAHYSRPYDKRVFDALSGTPLTVLHLHSLELPFLGQFNGFDAPVIQYSQVRSGISISDIRKEYSQVIAGGIDEINFEDLTTADFRNQWREARQLAGAKYIIAPGCSVPNSSPESQLAKFARSII